MKTAMKTTKTERVTSSAISTLRRTAPSLALLLLVTCAAPIAAYADAGGIPKAVANLQAAVATVQTQVVTLQSANTNLESALAALQTRIASLESANTALRNAVTALQAKDSSQDSALTALQTKDVSHDSRLASLQTQLQGIVSPESFQAGASQVGIPSDFSEHLIVKLDLPAGKYVVVVKGSLGLISGGDDGYSDFSLQGPGGIYDGLRVGIVDDFGANETTVSLMSNISLATPNTISVTGLTSYDGMRVRDFKLIAIRVGSLH